VQPVELTASLLAHWALHAGDTPGRLAVAALAALFCRIRSAHGSVYCGAREGTLERIDTPTSGFDATGTHWPGAPHVWPAGQQKSAACSGSWREWARLAGAAPVPEQHTPPVRPQAVSVPLLLTQQLACLFAAHGACERPRKLTGRAVDACARQSHLEAAGLDGDRRRGVREQHGRSQRQEDGLQQCARRQRAPSLAGAACASQRCSVNARRRRGRRLQWRAVRGAGPRGHPPSWLLRDARWWPAGLPI
jgi:hypothetical protein